MKKRNDFLKVRRGLYHIHSEQHDWLIHSTVIGGHTQACNIDVTWIHEQQHIENKITELDACMKNARAMREEKVSGKGANEEHLHLNHQSSSWSKTSPHLLQQSGYKLYCFIKLHVTTLQHAEKKTQDRQRKENQRQAELLSCYIAKNSLLAELLRSIL